MLSKCLLLTLISDGSELIFEGNTILFPSASHECFSSRLCYLFHYVVSLPCQSSSSPVVRQNRIWGDQSRGVRWAEVASAQSIVFAILPTEYQGIKHWDFLLADSAVWTGHVRTSATIIRQNIFNQDSTCLTIPLWSLYPRFYSRFLLFQSCRAVQAINL